MPKPIKEIILINAEYYTTLLKDIANAKLSIDLETYIFSDDPFTHQVADALIAAAKRGIKVRLLIDGVGSYTWGGSLNRKLEEADVKIRIYHPIPWFYKHWIRSKAKASIKTKMQYLFNKINRRNHRKVCIIDDDIVYIGSANISQYQLNKHNWRDTTVKLVNIDTRNLRNAFEKAWYRFPLYERAKLIFSRVPLNPRFRLNYSRHQRRGLYKNLLQRIAKSKKRIWITNAYFVPDAILLRRLIQASNRGVEVKILLPHKSDVFIYPLISQVFYRQLLQADISIYEYLPSILHAKVLIIDDWFCVGTSNLNYRSLRHDLEVDVNLETPTAKKILEKQFLQDLSDSKRILIEDVKRIPWYKKFFGSLLLYVQYWL